MHYGLTFIKKTYTHCVESFVVGVAVARKECLEGELVYCICLHTTLQSLLAL